MMRILAVFAIMLSFSPSTKCQSYFKGYSGGAKYIAEYPYKTASNFLGVGANATAYKTRLLYSIDYFILTDKRHLPGIGVNKYYQVNLKLGGYTCNDFFLFKYKAGVGGLFKKGFWNVLNGIEEYGYHGSGKIQDYVFFNIPVGVSFRFMPISNFSIGPDIEINLNVDRPSFFTMLSFEYIFMKK